MIWKVYLTLFKIYFQHELLKLVFLFLNINASIITGKKNNNIILTITGFFFYKYYNTQV